MSSIVASLVVAVIAPGMMGAAVGKRLVDNGVKVLTSLRGRSAETMARAKAAGTDPLGFYVPPLSYATFQVLEQAVEGAKTLDQGKLADYIHKTTFHTLYGDIAFGSDGEWVKPRILTVQYQNVKGHDLAQFEQPGTQPILDPPQFKTGSLRFPYSLAAQ